MKRHIIILLCLIFCLQLVAGSTGSALLKKGSITAIVLDNKGNQPIEYANIALIKSSDSSIVDGTITDEKGRFILTKIPKGMYHLEIHFLGYQTIKVDKIEISNGKMAHDLGSIKLKASAILLDEAEIMANNNYIDFKIDKKVVNVGEHINAEGGAVVDALHNVPSVQVDAGGNVSLRGSSSFILLIDGRPSIMEASEALNQIQASSVQNIEIITNPSVKYDSDGTSGIINLIMKKQKVSGSSGQASLSLYNDDKYAANVQFNHRANKISTNLGLTYSNKRKRTESKDNRQLYSGDTTYYQNIASDRDIYRRTYKFDGGINYDINDNNRFSFNMELGQWEFDRSIYSDIHLYDNYFSTEYFLNTEEVFKVTNKYINGDVAYTHQFAKKGHEIESSLYYSLLNNENPNEVKEIEVDQDHQAIMGTSNYINLMSRANRNHFRYKLDYSLPLSDIFSLESGYQIDEQRSGNTYDYAYRSDENELWLSDTALSGAMDFSRNIQSLYASLSTEMKGIGILAGMKIEYVDRRLNQANNTIEYVNQDFNFYPSLHINIPLKNEQQLGISYSRRVTRPNEWMLLPALHSTGRNMLQLGNPELLADFSNAYEINYNIRREKLMLSTDFYFRNTSNSITPSLMEKDGVFYQTYENLDQELSYGSEVMSNINILHWWRVNLSANFYYYELKGRLKSGFEVNDASFSWNGRFRTSFIIKKKTFFEFMAVYYGPQILAQGSSEEFYYFDFFLRRNFWNRKLSVALRAHNSFDTGIYIEENQGTNFKANTWFKYEGPTFLITLTYRLNNFNRRHKANNMDMNYDSGLDH